jgi:hypothetical protein
MGDFYMIMDWLEHASEDRSNSSTPRRVGRSFVFEPHGLRNRVRSCSRAWNTIEWTVLDLVVCPRRKDKLIQKYRSRRTGNRAGLSYRVEFPDFTELASPRC